MPTVNLKTTPTYSPHTIYLSPASKTNIIAEALIALANSEGGTIVIGLNKNGKPHKFPNPQATQDQLMSLALDCDPPLIIPSPTIKTHQGHPVLVITIPPDLPHVYNIDGRYLTLAEGEIVPLRGPQLRQLIFARGDSSFEGTAVMEASIDDLNWETAKTYVSVVETLRHLSVEEALIKRGCLKYEGGKLHPTKAGLLLFGKDPQKWLPQAEIIVARYTGLQMSDAFIRADIQGTLPEQARQAEAFIRENIVRDVRLDALQRTEAYLYPLSAVREVIINALAHRDYSIQGDNIRLLLFANRMECYSPGRLPGHITVNNIIQERFSRNAAIVQVLFDMGFIERLGYGIDRIIHTLNQLKLPHPEFSETAAGFQVTLYSDPQSTEAQHATTMRQWLEMGLNERQIAALNLIIQQKRITNADYQDLCPDVSPETLRRDLADLVKRNILLRIGEKRATFYILK